MGSRRDDEANTVFGRFPLHTVVVMVVWRCLNSVIFSLLCVCWACIPGARLVIVSRGCVCVRHGLLVVGVCLLLLVCVDRRRSKLVVCGHQHGLYHHFIC